MIWREKKKKQVVIARSSVEAEFRAMTQGICELLWLRLILTRLRMEKNSYEAIS